MIQEQGRTETEGERDMVERQIGGIQSFLILWLPPTLNSASTSQKVKPSFSNEVSRASHGSTVDIEE